MNIYIKNIYEARTPEKQLVLVNRSPLQTIGEMEVSWHVFQKTAPKTRTGKLNFRNEWYTSEKVDIYATNSRYKNVQTIYDYFEIMP